MLAHIVQTLLHKWWVLWYLLAVCMKLLWRGIVHDLSKFSKEERRRFADVLPALKVTTYGSPEYDSFLDRLRPALVHHYKRNRHHPEHWNNGVDDMDLLDVIEMWCDWKAACRRHDDGDIGSSVEQNRERFHLSPQFHHILANSVQRV